MSNALRGVMFKMTFVSKPYIVCDGGGEKGGGISIMRFSHKNNTS